jgi:hypothetical protein
MASQRLSIRIQPTLERRLKERANLTGKNESSIAREALEKYLSEPCPEATVYDVAPELGLIVSVKGTPKDLSANPEHLRDFGKH